MLQIQATRLSKNYNRQIVFKNFSAIFESGKKYAILGPNGSGKSTLLKVLSQYTTPESGTVEYYHNQKRKEPHLIFKHISYVAPYVALFRNFTTTEMLEWIRQSKGLSYSPKDILEITQLYPVRNKYLKHLSSGMQQRLKLATAIFVPAEVLFLDEPCTNLDQTGIQLYQNWIQTHTLSKIVIIASNQPHEYEMCDMNFNMLNYK
ncbi:MAG: ABC transporter ATP-binding protein [Bacteroidia bacterium]|nr:ABC transporter ATP-binding protein [Bacteroidia bacterium]MDW8301545.1 ABC transporter ATP-binding protein [Bacteroidia bacterium]